MNRPVPMSEVCAEGRHVRCQGHGADGPCRCTDPAHDPKQAAADMRAAVRAIRANPVKAGVAPQHAEKYDEDPFDVVDDPGLVRRALRFARSVNATTGGTP